MIKLLVNVALLIGFVYLLKEMFSPSSAKTKARKAPPEPRPRQAKPTELLVQDPQCGVYLPASEALKGPDGQHFCSEECLKAFTGKED